MDLGVPKLSGEGGFSFDPAPKANADLIIGSIYWLSDNEDYIAAGPAQIKPVNVAQHQKYVLWTLCVIGLPLLVVAAGGAVLVIRKR